MVFMKYTGRRRAGMRRTYGSAKGARYGRIKRALRKPAIRKYFKSRRTFKRKV